MTATPLPQIDPAHAPAHVDWDTYAGPVAAILDWSNRLTDDDILLAGAWADRGRAQMSASYVREVRTQLAPAWVATLDGCTDRTGIRGRQRSVAALAALAQPTDVFDAFMLTVRNLDWCVRAALAAVFRGPRITDEQTVAGCRPYHDVRALLGAAADQPPSVLATVRQLAPGFPGTPAELVTVAAATELG